MSDCHGNNGTSSALTENRQGNRGGGCVGILFQLFDWHRRFAKKQLFKRKLLPPPAVAKQAVKKFKGDEKMPTAKLHLIFDENKGGFPSMRKNGSRNVDAEQKHGTQAPGLVARLMGLEAMPLVHQKVKKNPPSETDNDKREKLVNGSSGLRKEDLNEEKGDMKQELRPPKFQKTGESDGGVVIRFRGEALQIKNVLARSRKHHHHKLVTPVESPRITASNNMSRTSSRLIDAATKILEPGLQNKRRPKCALPYISSAQLASAELEMAEKSLFASADMQRHAVTGENLANKHSLGQSPCKNCGNLLDIVNCRPIMKEEICNLTSMYPHHFDDSSLDRQRPARSAVVPQKKIFHRGKQQESPAVDSLSGRHGCGQIKYVKPFMDSRDGCPIDGRKRNPHRDEMAVEERIMPGSRNGYLKGRSASRSLSVTSTYDKDFVAPNRSTSTRTHLTSPARADYSEMDVERRNRTRRSKSLSEVKRPLPKMRSSIEHPTTAICLLAKQKSNNELPGKGNTARCSENINGVVSFTFKSAVNYKAGYSNEGKNNRQGPNGFNKTSLESKSVLGENLNDGLQQKHYALSGDALGAFLEQKLKELSSQEEGATICCKMSKRPTAVILQELITAVTEEAYLPECGVAADFNKAFQVKPNIHNAAKVLPDVNSLSPGSVLQASFSNDSCISGICDDISGSKLNAHAGDYSIVSLPPIVQDVRLLDSATSLNMGGTHFTKLTELICHIATMMDSLILADRRLAGSKVNLAKDIILHTELLIASFSPENPKSLDDVMCTLLQMECPEVETLFSLGDAEVGSDMKAFTLDCLLECLDKGYHRYCNFGYKGWAKQLSSWSPEMLKLDIVNEVRRWTSLSGLTMDEIIDHDMGRSTGKWTDFDIEAFELGAAFANDMLVDAVEEITASILCPAG